MLNQPGATFLHSIEQAILAENLPFFEQKDHSLIDRIKDHESFADHNGGTRENDYLCPADCKAFCRY